jgi:hypothetical protein
VADNGPNNGRVTNAILATKLDIMHDDIQEVCARLNSNEKRIRAVEQEQVRQSERIGIFGMINAGWSVAVAAVSGAIAATFGK